MQRLRGIDAGYLYMETPTLHMHTLKLAVLDPSTMPGGYTLERVKDELASRLHLLPPFRRRIIPVPGRLHHPVWIEDPDFDIADHVRRIEVPAPGTQAQMDAVVADIASTQLDRRRPLWELWVLEGLEGGHIGFLAKIHHTAADGVAATAMLANVMTTAPDEVRVEPDGSWRPEAVPSPWRLVVDAIVDRFTQLRLLPALVGRTARGMVAARRVRKGAEVPPPRPIRDTPNTSFNTALTPNRSFASSSLSLADMKHVKNTFGVTLNDVFLAIVAGSLRRYLEARSEDIAKPLVAGIPVATDKPGSEPRLVGNKVSNMFASLRDDIADPVERVRAISAGSRTAKELHNLLGAEMMEDWVEFTPPGPFSGFMRLYSRLRLADRHNPPINLVVSNVPGPREPLYIAGARLVGIYSVGPILEGIGLNVTVWSYLDSMNVGAIACRESLPDLHEITGGMADALVELVKAADRERRADEAVASPT